MQPRGDNYHPTLDTIEQCALLSWLAQSRASFYEQARVLPVALAAIYLTPPTIQIDNLPCVLIGLQPLSRLLLATIEYCSRYIAGFSFTSSHIQCVLLLVQYFDKETIPKRRDSNNILIPPI